MRLVRKAAGGDGRALEGLEKLVVALVDTDRAVRHDPGLLLDITNTNYSRA
jgi:hypothetical protein